MKVFRTTLLMVVTVTGLALAGGCATPNDDNVSSIPWDRPQSWEGSGALGAFGTPGTGH